MSASAHVAIVGGGPAGCALAIVLARSGVSVTLLEAESVARAKVGECLSPGFGALLAQLGLKQDLSPEHLPAYGNRSIWGSDEVVDQDFIFRAEAESWHLDRVRFEEQLALTATASGARFYRGARVRHCVRVGEAFELQLERMPRGLGELSADFVVDATGRSARVARNLGARRVRHDPMIALVSNFRARTGGISDTFTLVEATATGWWYSAALTSGRLVLSFMTDGDLLDRTAVRAQAWWQALGCPARTLERLQPYLTGSVERLKLVAAGSARLDRIVGPGWIAVGDAAAAHDPLASYGIGSALGSGYYAAHAIRDHLAGRAGALDAYLYVMDRAYAAYLAQLHATYRAEQRWPDSPFWARRHRDADGTERARPEAPAATG